MARYRLREKIAALDALSDCDNDTQTASQQTGIPAKTLRTWFRQRDDLLREWRIQQADKQSRAMLALREQMIDKARFIVNAIDTDCIDKAPLNQLSSALGTLIDRFLKLEEEIPDLEREKVYRIEYVYDGSVHKTPPWADPDSGESGAVQGGGVRETVREDGDGQAGTRPPRYIRPAWLVDGPDVPDGEPGVAGLEEHDQDERLWYHD